MAWKKITNRCKNIRTVPDNSITYEMLEQYLGELVLNLNLQLFCEREGDELFPAEKLLWVDNVTITAYETDSCSGRTSQNEKQFQRELISQSTKNFLGKMRDCLLVLWRIGQLPYP